VTALAAGSVSLRLYPHADLPAPAIVDELRAQAALAAQNGFDGVMTSEHHGGFAGYLPNPLQAAGWCLEAMATGWAAACPLLLPLRPTALVVEEVAWLAARFPGRVGVGVAAGALEHDFEIMGIEMEDLGARFAVALEELSRVLDGTDAGELADDPAVKACSELPIPVVSAAMSFTAARRAARLGVGLLFDSLTTPERCRALTDAYREAGGTGPCILVRRAWVGAPPVDEMEHQVDVYRGYADAGAQAHWQGDQLVGSGEAAEVVAGLADAALRAGTDAVNVRVHAPGVPPEMLRDQIARLGSEVIDHVRDALRSRSGSAA
jgi:alkanesulfonate monooxygenase SsuD/methylene tetrahydromethanopterin reductase-like flavin-dependent oxidoreductase (luciferase family)